jgi:hypothetical protein
MKAVDAIDILSVLGCKYHDIDNVYNYIDNAVDDLDNIFADCQLSYNSYFNYLVVYRVLPRG